MRKSAIMKEELENTTKWKNQHSKNQKLSNPSSKVKC